MIPIQNYEHVDLTNIHNPITKQIKLKTEILTSDIFKTLFEILGLVSAINVVK